MTVAGVGVAVRGGCRYCICGGCCLCWWPHPPPPRFRPGPSPLPTRPSPLSLRRRYRGSNGEEGHAAMLRMGWHGTSNPLQTVDGPFFSGSILSDRNLSQTAFHQPGVFKFQGIISPFPLLFYITHLYLTPCNLDQGLTGSPVPCQTYDYLGSCFARPSALHDTNDPRPSRATTRHAGGRVESFCT